MCTPGATAAIPAEAQPAFDPTHHDAVKDAGGVEPEAAGDGGTLPTRRPPAKR